MAGLTHVGTPSALGRMQAAMFELMRGDHTRTQTNVSPELARIVRYDSIYPCSGHSAGFSEAGRDRGCRLVRGRTYSTRRGVNSLRAQNILTFFTAS